MEPDLALLRDLASKYMDICREDVQVERRDLWRRHNSLQRTRPLIYVRAFAGGEMTHLRPTCEDPFYRQYEGYFRQMLFRHSFNDDTIFEPWVTVGAHRWSPPHGIWGVPVEWTRPQHVGGAGIWDPPIKTPADLERLALPRHEIDEAATARNVERLQDAIGDIITVNVDRCTIYRGWSGDISTHLAYLRGLEQVMLDMSDNREFLHRLLTHMRNGIMKAQQEAEDAGDWSLANHENQAMPYAEELEDPAANRPGVGRQQLWCFFSSQELTGVGPAMFDEFMVAYQRPIIEEFGLSAYGCCEDLTHNIDVLRQIGNLRRIAVSPMANVPACARQIGQDYVLSYRPSPADMVAYGFDPDRIRRLLRRDLAACGDSHVDITLKDVQTVQGDPDRIRKWVEITREVIDEIAG